MSKITKVELQDILCTRNTLNGEAVLALDERIEQREAEFAELVEAVAQVERFLTQVDPVHWPSRSEAREIIKVVRDAQHPFLPPPSPADRLDAIGDFLRNTGLANRGDEIIAIAAELREKGDN